MNELLQFLQKRTIDPNNTSIKSTHTKAFSPTAKYNIPDDLNETFLTLYCNSVNDRNILGITELPNIHLISPLRVDFDFRLDPSKYNLNNSPINLDLIKEIVKIYQIVIQEFIDCSPSVTSSTIEVAQMCILFKKNGGYRIENGELKDGFHLHFPHFHIHSWIQNNTFRRRVMELISESGLLRDIRFDPSIRKGNILEKLVDPIASKTWLMYGSRKNKEAQAWKVFKCYDSGLQETELEYIFDEELQALCSEEGKTSVQYYLPRLLSIRNTRKEDETPLKARYRRYGIDRLRSTRRNNVRHKSPEVVDEELRVIEEADIMGMINPRRSQERNTWMDIGWCLFCIGDGDERFLNLWIEFSKLCPEKFSEDKCVEEWGKMQHRGKTLWSLMRIAEEDSPDKYYTWRTTIKEGIIENVLNSSEVTHYLLSKLLFKMYEGDFICSAHKNDEWYKFHSNIWHPLDGAVEIRLKLLQNVGDEFRHRLARELTNYSYGESDITKIRKRKLDSTIKMIESSQGCNSIITMSKNLFYDGNFNKMSDRNDYLFPFENGVFDLDVGFRKGRPDDYMTLSCGRYYREFDWNDSEIKAVELFWKKIFPDPDLYEYFQDLMASCLKGGNRRKIFPIFTGNHDGGKSLTVKFICKAFGVDGGFAFVFPREFLQTKSIKASSGSARPELYQAKGKRVTFLPELSEKEELDVGILKSISGGDANWVRTLYHGKGEIIEPKYVTFLQCNKPPRIPGHDEATWTRVRLIDFESTFYLDKSKVPPTLEEQFRQKKFPADPELKNDDDKLNEMCEPWLWMLIQRYKKLRRSELKTPKKVLMSTENYKKSNDVYMQFVSECLQRTDNEKDTIAEASIFTNFKEWYKDNYPSYFIKERPGKTTVREEMSKKMGPFKTKGIKISWEGWKLKGEVNEQFEFVEPTEELQDD